MLTIGLCKPLRASYSIPLANFRLDGEMSLCKGLVAPVVLQADSVPLSSSLHLGTGFEHFLCIIKTFIEGVLSPFKQLTEEMADRKTNRPFSKVVSVSTTEF